MIFPPHPQAANFISAPSTTISRSPLMRGADASSRRPQRLVSNPKTRLRPRFPKHSKKKKEMPSSCTSSTARIEEIFDDSENDSSLNTKPPPMADTPWSPTNLYVPPKMPPKTPDVFSTLPVLRDTYITFTSTEQDNTVRKVIPLLSSRDDPLPNLKRKIHIEFLEAGLNEKLPSYMTVLDASRPWIIYWCLTGLSLLGVDVTIYRERVISSLTPLQNAIGGFGGSHGHMSHLAPSYAAVLSLATVGGNALSLVDRRTMLKWLLSIKQPNGCFTVAVGGESDVRAIYCALTVISLLRLPVPKELIENTLEYLASCQTYEGGFAATPGGNEAHGGYTFCALAALCILLPPKKLNETVDMPALVRWLSMRQYAPEGGLSGRTNKLVDGCYSTWIGGCWALIEAALGVDMPLWSREGLIRYIMAATQCPYGGLRDKPGKGADSYHTCYVLLGLGNAMYHHTFEETGEEAALEGEGLPLMAPFRWKGSKVVPGVETLVEGFEGWPDMRFGDEAPVTVSGGLKGDRVAMCHPIFNIRYEMVEEARRWGDGLVGF
ncbi:terpenoid cyclases/protein prenyltransferase alpha-alpha toroid [Sphaerosporella brunnea]|uniref:Protein farnesyltransferase subunit beta n=1 Tax=Sphaerosporella brunnea TaxID=1250544 RepID=A0A5J5EGY3_9PEZI|nr:terpenoid cyclases/protein prenyltransferase alpha-alpha toroid [Sphaerosporella brunnea]